MFKFFHETARNCADARVDEELFAAFCDQLPSQRDSLQSLSRNCSSTICFSPFRSRFSCSVGSAASPNAVKLLLKAVDGIPALQQLELNGLQEYRNAKVRLLNCE